MVNNGGSMSENRNVQDASFSEASELIQDSGLFANGELTDAIAPSARPSDNVSPEMRFKELVRLAGAYLPEEDMLLLEKAYRFAESAHKGQKRKSGEPFIAHPVEVALILADLRMDVDTLCAALLHDTVEDTDVTHKDLLDTFNEGVANLVEGVTKITQVEVESLTDEQAATIRKMFVAMSHDIRVIVIKLADRLHNMRTLSALREDRRIFKAHETLEIYAPIAHRLGIGSIKWELEDLSFYYLDPARFKQIAQMVAESRAQREAYLSRVIETLRDDVNDLNIKAHIAGRPKHLYSINQKMINREKGFSEIYDLIAVRIIVESVKDCYSVLGSVHSLWHPMPGRFKDYIAMPKANGYQSLHTTVIGPAGRPLEVQIRTEEMHRLSEYGVAAHWRYKEKGNSKADAAFDKQIAWLRQMVDWQDETQDSREFLSELKVDLAPSEVFVFTPAGEVMSLRAGSTPIDFAYSVHTEVGNHCVGAKVNGDIVPLSYQLKMGDRVEILTQKSASPSRDWLKIVATASARSKIRNYLAKVSRSDDLVNGRDKVSRDLKKQGFGLGSTASIRAQRQVADQLGYRDVDDMMVAVGAGKETVNHVVNRILKILAPEPEDTATPEMLAGLPAGTLLPMLTTVKRAPRRTAHASNGVVVTGLDDAPVRLSRCCNPVPGDEIIGFITRGRGVSVHRADCPNASDLLKDRGRIIEVNWADSVPSETSYQVEVYIEAMDRLNLLRDIINALSDTGVNVISSSTSSHSDGIVEMRYLFQVSQVSNIERILADLRSIDGVFEARRMLPGDAIHRR